MRTIRHVVLAAGLVGMTLASVGVVGGQGKISFQQLEESLTCQCGCGLTVHSCNHLQCGSALPLRDEIREQMGLGKDKPAILAHFRDKYGEKILSSPTAEGFNLFAWITPFALVGVGFVLVGVTVSRWRKRSTVLPAAPAADGKGPAKPGSAYDKVLERELKNFDS